MTAIAPMMAVLASEPFDDDEWGFEPKWDGVRAVVEVESGRVRMWSRNGNEISTAYPEIMVLSGLPDGTIVDGEVVAFRGGRPSFERLQSRMHLRDGRRVERAAIDNPVVFMAFDLLADGDEDLTARPLAERRERLERVLPLSEQVQLSPLTIGAGRALFEAAKAQRLEGIVAKRMDSIYVVGRRSSTWKKIKVVHDVDAVIVGWRPGSGGRSNSLGSLVLALHADDGLRYVGSVGSGFDHRSLTAMLELMRLVGSDSPFLPVDAVPGADDVHWVRPELVAAVEYREVTSSGHLRAPVFKGMRSDKDPRSCTIDQLA